MMRSGGLIFLVTAVFLTGAVPAYAFEPASTDTVITPSDTTIATEDSDTTPPKFTNLRIIEAVNKEQMSYLIVEAKDTSGIVTLEVMESSENQSIEAVAARTNWKKINSPHALKSIEEAPFVYVRATDQDQNARIEKLERAAETQSGLNRIIATVVFIVMIGGVGFITKRSL